jgi:glutamine amidotransferase
MSKIVIIDYNSGNIDSVKSAVNYHGYDCKISKNYIDIKNAKKIILPGQGSFLNGMQNIVQCGLYDLIRNKALNENVPILGICLGMQILATKGFENGEQKGLDLIPGVVKKMNIKKFKLPHIGWNNVNILNQNPILENIKQNTDFYFVHSYEYLCENPNNILLTTEYEKTFTSGVFNKNIYGLQFHPEKSLTAGLTIIKNFLSIKC